MRQETTMVAKTDEKLPLYKRAGHEFVELAILTLYLYVTIGAVIMMKTAVLQIGRAHV